MKAIGILSENIGGPELLEVVEVTKPVPTAGEVLLQVKAAALTPDELTWPETWYVHGESTQPRPRPIIPGHEVSGIVEAVGEKVTEFQVGDEVYGLSRFDHDGVWAEYTIVTPNQIARRPRSVGHEESAALSLSALTAWQALFKKGNLQAGQRILIHGAAGGVGNYAVQLAHRKGAYVIAVASGQHRETLLGLGADEVIDYITTNVSEAVSNIDFIFDVVGASVIKASFKLLKPEGTYVGIASNAYNLVSKYAEQYQKKGIWFIVEADTDDLTQLAHLTDEGHLKPQIEKVYPLEQARQAYERLLKGHLRGKLVLSV
ncbi:NADP-dependent oxidoreductase [Ktedonospora formicarum]|uniref:NADPH:quinone reductase n=1 Tax=Ktedonospora formicarum TaxID=2778364 RepID=A0A8J3IET7_9CHLR|nr:NADP-dependent oxidoreductase [Ktedonospora formicarum]GHO50644.1 NADPH:quinone reductase [Ktedonospora formicarum]